MIKKLIQKIKAKQISVCIIGLGYVGLPLAFRFLNAKIKVIGIDNNKSKIEKIKSGISYIENKKFSKNKFYKEFQLNTSNNYANVGKADVIILCLPTPLNKNRTPNMSSLKNCINKIKKYTKINQILILESTVYPGATIELFNLLNKEKKFLLGKNFYLAFSPERENPGDKLFSYKSTPKVVSGFSKNCSLIVYKLYQLIAKKVFLANSIAVAELSKLLENTYRSVNIALVNEFKIISNKLGVNIWDIINAAKTKNFGFRPFNPGPGVGGHCIPIDPIYLSWYMKNKNYKSKIIEISSTLNSSMPNWVSNQIFRHLRKNKIKTKKVLLVGLAYKKNTADTRESPSLDILRKLIDKKFKVEFYDPYVKEFDFKSKYFNNKSLSTKSIKKYRNDGFVIIGTDHKNVNYKKIFVNSKLIFDSRGVYSKNKSKKIIFV
jgi:UDP-N-acetyl-D-glucosamine dehydrogenase